MAPTAPRYRLHTISYRNRRKITVVDGLIGYTGGMNIGQEHLDGGPGFDAWRDTRGRIVGEGAAVLQAVCMVDWYNAVQENLFAASYFPSADDVPAADPVQILTSGPDSQWAAIRQLYFYMIASAQRRVRMQSPAGDKPVAILLEPNQRNRHVLVVDVLTGICSFGHRGGSKLVLGEHREKIHVIVQIQVFKERPGGEAGVTVNTLTRRLACQSRHREISLPMWRLPQPSPV